MDKGFSGDIVGDGWSGNVMSSDHNGLYTHVVVSIHQADSEAIANSALDYIYTVFAGGRQRFLRVPKRVEYFKSFDPKGEGWKGFMRFSFAMEPGGEQVATPADVMEARA